MDTHDRERGKRKEKRAAGTSRPFKNSIKKYNNKPPLRKRSSLATTERSKSLHRGIASYNRKTVENDKDLLSKSAETECLKEIVEHFCGDAEELNTSAAEIVASRNGSDANHSQIESNFPDKVTALNSNMHLGEQMKNHSFSEKHDSFSSNLWDMFEQGYYPSKVPHDFSTNPFSSKRMEIDNHLLSIQQDQAHLLSMLDKRYPPIMLETLKEEDEFSEPDSKINSENDSQNTISTGTSSSATQGGLHINFGPSDVLVCEQDEIKYESKSKSGKLYGRLRKVGVVDAPSPSITANVLYENKWALDHDVESNSLGSDNSTTVMFKDPGQSSVFGQLFGCLPIHKKNMFGKKRDLLQPQGEKKVKVAPELFNHKHAHTCCYTPSTSTRERSSVKESFDENIGEDLYVQLAASHVGDAMDGRGRFGLAHAFFKTKRLKSVYSVLSSRLWRLVMYFTILTHSIALTFEQPLLPYFVGEQWDSSNTRPYLSILIIDAICILIYASDVCLHSIFLSWRNLWSAKETIHLRAELMLTLLFTVDFIILITQNSIKVRLVCPFRCLRATMLLCKSKHVSHIFNVLLSIIAKLGKVFFIIIIFIVTFSCIGLHLFLQDYQDLGYTCHNQTAQWNCSSIYEGAFNNLASATMHMFVLMSTENYPEFIIPAFSRTWANFFYFGFYLYVGVFFLTAILLAIIVESYWEYSKVHVKQERKQQREQLAQAWNLLDPLGKGEIPVDDPSLIRLFKIIMPKNTEEENRALIKYISLQSEDELKVDADDDDEGNVVVAYDWTTKLIDALSFEFDKEACFVEDGKQGRLRRFVNSKTFSVVVLNLILVHSLLFCCMWDGITDETQLDIQIARSVIVTFFFIEFLLRMIAEGRRMFNMYDMVDSAMIVFANTGSITWFVLWTVNRDDPVHLGACVVVSSISVLIRTFFISLHARSSIGVLRSIYPVMFDLIILVVIIIFFYAVVGYECFQDNTLEASRSSGYVGSYTEYECEAGFKSFGCSLLSVFQIVTSNDWHELMLGAQLDAGWQSAFYFITCYLIINMIVMNLFVAISIEAYKKLAKYDRRDHEKKAKRLSAVSAARSHIGQFFAVSSQRDSNTWSEMRPASHLLSPSLDPTMTSPELKRVIMRRKSVVTSVNRYVQMSDLQKPPNVEENDDDDDDDTQLSALSDINLTLQEKFTKREQLLKEKQKARRERRKELKSISESSFSSSASCASLKSRENMEKCSDPVVKKLATIIERSSPRNSRHQQRTSQIRLIRRADGNWPRNIHGEMTIMNHDELKQLSPLFRGGLEVGKRHSTHSTNKPFSVSSGVMDVMRRTSIHLPLVTVSESAEVNGNEVAGTSKASSNERRRSRGTLLDISKLQLQLKTRDCKKSTKKRYPSWMQRFVDEKNLSVDGDVKLKSHRNNK